MTGRKIRADKEVSDGRFVDHACAGDRSPRSSNCLMFERPPPSGRTTSPGGPCWWCSSASTAPTSSAFRMVWPQFGRDYADTGSRRSSPLPPTTPRLSRGRSREPGESGREIGYPFPVLYDETQEVAMAFTAACTPTSFCSGRDHRLVYRGQFDSARPSNDVPVTGESLRAAVDAVLAAAAVPIDQIPSMGCSIKWRSETSGPSSIEVADGRGLEATYLPSTLSTSG